MVYNVNRITNDSIFNVGNYDLTFISGNIRNMSTMNLQTYMNKDVIAIIRSLETRYAYCWW